MNKNLNDYLPQVLLVIVTINLIVVASIYYRLIGNQSYFWIVDLMIPSFIAIYGLILFLAYRKVDIKKNKEEMNKILDKE